MLNIPSGKLFALSFHKSPFPNHVGAAFHCISNKQKNFERYLSFHCWIHFMNTLKMDFLCCPYLKIPWVLFKISSFHYSEDDFCIGIRTLIYKLTDSGRDMVLAWVPNHWCIPENENADSLVKDANFSGEFLYILWRPDDLSLN